MAKCIAVHKLKKSPEEVAEGFDKLAPGFAKANESGKNPAKCIYTWNSIPHERKDYVFCLWEAKSAKDIEASLGKFLDYLTVESVKVDEIVWKEVAKGL